MDTSTAAAQAAVTTATIRTWCRIGAVAAVKTDRRWDIEPASLAHRIALTAKPPRPLTAEDVVALGGNRWTKNGMDRVYLQDWTRFAGLEISYYNTGNVSGACLGGRPIANSRAEALRAAISKVWFDTADGQLYARHDGGDAIQMRFLDGSRETVDLLATTFEGIRATARAL